MTLIDQLNNCCQTASETIDGVYGSGQEMLAILGIVLVFNFLIKWLLKKLHARFSSHDRIWADAFVKALFKPLSCFVWFFAAIHASEIAYEKFFPDKLFDDMHTVVTAGAILATAWFAMSWKKHLIENMGQRNRIGKIAIEKGKVDVLDKLLTLAIAFLTTLLLLETFDRSITTLIAFGGVGGLALAFSSQEVIASFFGGMMVYLTHPFGVGDWVVLPEKGIEGHVEEIGWYMTRVRTLDKRPVYVPNSFFAKIVVVNPTRMSHRQFKETIGIRYQDAEKLRQLLKEIKEMLQHHADVDKAMPIVTRFYAFGNYSLDVMITCYTRITDSEGYYRVREDLLFLLMDIISAQGAELAFPTSCIEVNLPEKQKPVFQSQLI